MSLLVSFCNTHTALEKFGENASCRFEVNYPSTKDADWMIVRGVVGGATIVVESPGLVGGIVGGAVACAAIVRGVVRGAAIVVGSARLVGGVIGGPALVGGVVGGTAIGGGVVGGATIIRGRHSLWETFFETAGVHQRPKILFTCGHKVIENQTYVTIHIINVVKKFSYLC